MHSVSAAMFSLSAVAFLAARRGWLAAFTFALSLTSCVLAWGGAVGALVQLVLAMAAASLLVLILPVQTKLSKPVALATAALGIVLLLGERLVP